MTWDQFIESNFYNIDPPEIFEEEILLEIDRMEEAINQLKLLLDTNNESPEDIIYIEQEELGGFFEAWTKYRIYFSHEDDDYDIQVLSAFRHPPYVVIK